jgi:hypothetical protein
VFCSVSVAATVLGGCDAVLQGGPVGEMLRLDPGGERREDLGIPQSKCARRSCDKAERSPSETMPAVDLPRCAGRGSIFCVDGGAGSRFTTGFQRRILLGEFHC